MKNVRYSDFHHISVPGDGTCFFHSIAIILALEKGSFTEPKFSSKLKQDSKKIRLSVVRWLKKNLDYRIYFLKVMIIKFFLLQKIDLDPKLEIYLKN